MSPISGEDVKPDVSKIRITVEFNNKQLTFLYKKNKPLGKLLIMFCEKINVDRKTLRFNYEGQMISQEETTAQDLEMEDGDIIDGHIFQEGGHV
ncbi:hypothetical protein B0H13DRAFT_1961736 [Mycena leptocephala]|nr:hypothetical protein B0H13DRAFT_1961736 [Mycena leptocephala]